MPSQEQLNVLTAQGKMALCYDMDDTIIDFMTGEAFPNRVKEMIQRQKEGHYIIVATARVHITYPELYALLQKHGIPYNEIAIGTKPKAHIYIDDSAVNADDYFNNPEKYLKIFNAIGFRINWLIQQKGKPV